MVFDNNFRPPLWPGLDAARAAFAMLYAHCDIALVTLDDEAALDPGRSSDEILARVLALPCPEVVKRGAASTLVRCTGHAPAEVPVEVVANPLNTTAAGDSFAAGYLVRRLAGASAEAPSATASPAW